MVKTFLSLFVFLGKIQGGEMAVTRNLVLCSLWWGKRPVFATNLVNELMPWGLARHGTAAAAPSRGCGGGVVWAGGVGCGQAPACRSSLGLGGGSLLLSTWSSSSSVGGVEWHSAAVALPPHGFMGASVGIQQCGAVSPFRSFRF